MSTIRFVIKPVALLATALAVSACGQTKTYSSIEPGAQMDRSRARLELPPDLVDTTSDALLANQAEQAARAEEVLPEKDDLNIERNDEEGWVEVNVPVGALWNRLVSHWGAMGVELVVSDPKAGIMETDWVKPARSQRVQDRDQKEKLLDTILGNIVDAPTSLDKYTIQLERRSESRSRIYVSHKGVKKIQTSRSSVATNATWEWVEVEEDPEKVKRALSSIIYGLDTGAS